MTEDSTTIVVTDKVPKISAPAQSPFKTLPELLQGLRNSFGISLEHMCQHFAFAAGNGGSNRGGNGGRHGNGVTISPSRLRRFEEGTLFDPGILYTYTKLLGLLPPDYPPTSAFTTWVKGTNLLQMMQNPPIPSDIEVFRFGCGSLQADFQSRAYLTLLYSSYSHLLPPHLDRGTEMAFEENFRKAHQTPAVRITSLTFKLVMEAEHRGLYPIALSFLDLADRIPSSSHGDQNLDAKAYVDVIRARIHTKIGYINQNPQEFSAADAYLSGIPPHLVDTNLITDPDPSWNNLPLRAWLERARLIYLQALIQKKGREQHYRKAKRILSIVEKGVIARDRTERGRLVALTTPIAISFDTAELGYHLALSQRTLKQGNVKPLKPACDYLRWMATLRTPAPSHHTTEQEPFDFSYADARTSIHRVLFVKDPQQWMAFHGASDTITFEEGIKREKQTYSLYCKQTGNTFLGKNPLL